ncbi:unnamed protein product [Parnassius apollo]|uniref:ATP-dependent DNA helicase n=1 Tax=Parnassius apollo TaxID=110799 RepID=A0A8S3YCT5_PARAO|nr:unnamed protein product [Parnassius apollo]
MSHVDITFIGRCLKTLNGSEGLASGSQEFAVCESLVGFTIVIAKKLNTEATEGRNFQYWVQNFDFEDIDNYGLEDSQENLNTDESAVLGEQMYQLLKGKEIEIVNSILDLKCFFIDGPGGTGKTFIYKTLYYMLTGKRYRVKCMAFTGIASILLPNGRTFHKTFGLKVPLTPDSVSSIVPNSSKARHLAEIDIFLMDEAPMLPKYGLQNIDQLLRSIGNSDLPFVGKVIVLGGDSACRNVCLYSRVRVGLSY